MGHWRIVLCVQGLLIFGCLNTLTTKIQFTIVSEGLDQEEKLFQKPWFGTFAMFVGMSLSLVGHYIFTSAAARPKGASDIGGVADGTPFLGPSGEGGLSTTTAFFYIGVPAMFDLLASGLIFFGLLYTSASIWQMLRGAEIIFCAIFSVTFLGRRMAAHHYVGVFLCILGVTCVGVASCIVTASKNADATPSPTAISTAEANLGLVVILFGQSLAAAQMVAEEKLLKDVRLPAMQIVGFEGVWGIMLMLFVVFPIVYMIPGSDSGSFENIQDTFVMLQNSRKLVILVFIYIFSCATYNVSGMMVTDSLSAVHRTMLEAFRTCVVWLVDLVVYYCISSSLAFGESWNYGSYMELFGFLLLILGQSIYGEVLRLPCFTYAPVDLSALKWASPSSIRHLGSPVPKYSK